jgi:hypothetical protein
VDAKLKRVTLLSSVYFHSYLCSSILKLPSFLLHLFKIDSELTLHSPHNPSHNSSRDTLASFFIITNVFTDCLSLHKSLTMSTFNALRAHLEALEDETDRLMNDMDRFEATHDNNRISITQLDKEFAVAKFAEDKLQEELDKAWKKTDSVKNKRRKLVRTHPFYVFTHAESQNQNREQMKLQSEQADKWSQFKVKMAIVVSLRSFLSNTSSNHCHRTSCAACAEIHSQCHK